MRWQGKLILAIKGETGPACILQHRHGRVREHAYCGKGRVPIPYPRAQALRAWRTQLTALEQGEVAGWPALYFAGRPGCRRAAAATAPPAGAEPGACGRAAALVACEHAAAAVWAGRQGATDWVSEQGAALWASWQHIRTFGQLVACSVGKHKDPGGLIYAQVGR